MLSPALEELRDNPTAVEQRSTESNPGTGNNFLDTMKRWLGVQPKENREKGEPVIDSSVDDAYYSARSSLSNSLVSGSSYERYQKCELVDSWSFEESYIKVQPFSPDQDSAEIGEFGTYEEFRECQMQQELANKIKDVVETSALRKIQITDGLCLRTACNIMNLAKSEPYGLKGCKVIILIDDVDDKFLLGSLYPETEEVIISTFEVTLVLHLKKPCHVRFFGSGLRPKVLTVADQFELRKEKLYMSKTRRGSPSFLS